MHSSPLTSPITSDRARPASRCALAPCLLAAVALAAGPATARQAGYDDPTNTIVTTGPDVTIWTLPGTRNWGTGNSGTIRAYSIATDSCNIGTEKLKWCDESSCAEGATVDEHPVIAQNLYRLDTATSPGNGRFRQIGKNWIKHGFNSLNDRVQGGPGEPDRCRGNDGAGGYLNCPGGFLDGDFLFVGCTDLYGSTTNGQHVWLGPRHVVNATTGANGFQDPPGHEDNVPSGDEISERIQVPVADLQTGDYKYWIEGHYIAADDAQAGNALNNASYREVTLSGTSQNLSVTGNTWREAAALYAWWREDSTVEVVTADFITSGGMSITERFHVARHATPPTARGANWHYEVVVHNMNSDRSAGALRIEFPSGTSFSNPGMSFPHHHSGSPYSGTAWSATEPSSGTLRFATEDHGTNANANAVRWGTAYTFWFDADAPPSEGNWTIELFKPGTPSTVTVPFVFFGDGFESGSTNGWSETTP